MILCSTKAIAATIAIAGIVTVINLGVIVSLFVDIGNYQNDANNEMIEFNAVADQAWDTIVIILPATAAREKRATGCGGCSSQPNNCPRGLVGPRGRPGAKGPDGVNGIPGPDGVSGLVAISISKKACIKCAPGPPGLKGLDGFTGERGVDGIPGSSGFAGRDGFDGSRGPMGDVGAKGSDGATGPRGHPGSNGIRGRGAVGEQGRIGGRGNWGRQGRLGAIGVPGTPGPMGPSGEAGKDGENGMDGEMGAVGASGSSGKNGEYCLCPKKEEKEKKDPAEIAILDLAVQSLVESSAVKMEAAEAPASSTANNTDKYQISITSTTTEAALPAVEPVPMARGYDESASDFIVEIEESTDATSLSPRNDAAASVGVDQSSTTAYEQVVEEKTVTLQDKPSTSTAPPGFSPKSFEASTAGMQRDFAISATSSNENEDPIVQVTPVYHRGTGGGRTTPIPTLIVPVSKFVRHAGGWSRRATTSKPHSVPGSKKHDAELHRQRKSFGGARAV